MGYNGYRFVPVSLSTVRTPRVGAPSAAALTQPAPDSDREQKSTFFPAWGDCRKIPHDSACLQTTFPPL